MVDEILTLAILLILLVFVLYQIKIGNNCVHMLGKQWTTAIKGICCIVVIFVHIPAEYSTKLQTLIGSFAYIAVTVFFTFSGYGLSIAKEKKGYLNHFWRNRLVSLLVPMALVNVIKEIWVVITVDFDLNVRFAIDGFVLMLTLCYIAWYFVEKVPLFENNVKAEVACLLILLISLSTYCFEDIIPFTVWPVPCLGFAYGILVAKHIDWIKDYFSKYKIIGTQTFVVAGLAILSGGGYICIKDFPLIGDYVLRSFLAFIVILFMFKLFAKIQFQGKMIQLIGNISYEVYLVHSFVINVLREIYRGWQPGIFIICVVAMSIIVSIIINRVAIRLICLMRTK